VTQQVKDNAHSPAGMASARAATTNCEGVQNWVLCARRAAHPAVTRRV